MTMLTIRKPGMLTTIQDEGRWHAQALGVPVSGAMDVFSLRVANALVGNARDAAGLEVTLVGPQIEFHEAATVSVAGAEFVLSVDAERRPVGVGFHVPAGAVLSFGERLRGARAYLAVAGGIDVPAVFGSRSTHVASRMGGFGGRALRAGDRLALGSAPAVSSSQLRVPKLDTGNWQLATSRAPVRVIPQPLFERMAGKRFTVSTRSDRMGFRLEGHVVEGGRADRLSSGVPTGAIQLPPSGEPIVLMADHATTGGYEIAAVVITADLPKVGQLAPGDWIEFEPCALADADRALQEMDARLREAAA